MEENKEQIETPEDIEKAPEETKTPEAEETVSAKEPEATVERYKIALADRDAEIARFKSEAAEWNIQRQKLYDELHVKEQRIQLMKEAADAQHAEAEKLGRVAEEAATAGKAVAEENEALKARIAELEANAKTAEELAAKIAAEKYAAALPAKTDPEETVDVPALKAKWDELQKERGPKFQAWIRGLNQAEYGALFEALKIKA